MPYTTAPGVLEGNAFLYSSAAIAFADHSGIRSRAAAQPYARAYG